MGIFFGSIFQRIFLSPSSQALFPGTELESARPLFPWHTGENLPSFPKLPGIKRRNRQEAVSPACPFSTWRRGSLKVLYGLHAFSCFSHNMSPACFSVGREVGREAFFLTIIFLSGSVVGRMSVPVCSSERGRERRSLLGGMSCLLFLLSQGQVPAPKVRSPFPAFCLLPA